MFNEYQFHQSGSFPFSDLLQSPLNIPPDLRTYLSKSPKLLHSYFRPALVFTSELISCYLHVCTRVCVPLIAGSQSLVRTFLIARDRNLICTNIVWKCLGSHNQEVSSGLSRTPVSSSSFSGSLSRFCFPLWVSLILSCCRWLVKLGRQDGFQQPQILLLPAS